MFKSKKIHSMFRPVLCWTLLTYAHHTLRFKNSGGMFQFCFFLKILIIWESLICYALSHTHVSFSNSPLSVSVSLSHFYNYWLNPVHYVWTRGLWYLQNCKLRSHPVIAKVNRISHIIVTLGDYQVISANRLCMVGLKLL